MLVEIKSEIGPNCMMHVHCTCHCPFDISKHKIKIFKIYIYIYIYRCIYIYIYILSSPFVTKTWKYQTQTLEMRYIEHGALLFSPIYIYNALSYHLLFILCLILFYFFFSTYLFSSSLLLRFIEHNQTISSM